MKLNIPLEIIKAAASGDEETFKRATTAYSNKATSYSIESGSLVVDTDTKRQNVQKKPSWQFFLYEPLKIDLRHLYEIKANTKEEAIERMKQIVDSDNYSGEYDEENGGLLESEYLYEYEEGDNGKSIELEDVETNGIIYRKTNKTKE